MSPDASGSCGRGWKPSLRMPRVTGGHRRREREGAFLWESLNGEGASLNAQRRRRCTLGGVL